MYKLYDDYQEHEFREKLLLFNFFELNAEQAREIVADRWWSDFRPQVHAPGDAYQSPQRVDCIEGTFAIAPNERNKVIN